VGVPGGPAVDVCLSFFLLKLSAVKLNLNINYWIPGVRHQNACDEEGCSDSEGVLCVTEPAERSNGE